MGPEVLCGSASAVWCWQSGVPYPLRRPWWPRCSRARAAASPPPMSRLSPQHSAAAVFRPAQRDAPGQPHRTRFSVCGFGRGRGAAAQGNRQSAPQPCWACSACVHSAARLILRSGRVRVGVEQQLHHLERRALGGGVVQGQLPILRRAAHSARRGIDKTKKDQIWRGARRVPRRCVNRGVWGSSRGLSNAPGPQQRRS
jgi:hypothetical protein